MTALQQPGIDICGCDAPERLKQFISLDEALRNIDRHTAPVDGIETLAPKQARGRVLAEPVVASTKTPPFDNAAMDGYAVVTSEFVGEGPWTLAIHGRVAAGQRSCDRLAGPCTVRIFTGAPVPEGTDAVVMQEDVRQIDGRIIVDRRPVPGHNIRRAGGDMIEGSTVVSAGTRLGAREIAACAAAGAVAVRVRRRIRVGLLVTGDEVRSAGQALGDAGIWDVNTPMLIAALDCPSVELFRVELGADCFEDLRRQLAEISDGADLIITTGGVSVGEEDHVKPAVSALGGDIIFNGVALKPGKPVSFGRLGSASWLGLPGNPLSAFVTWQVFGTALHDALTGASSRDRQRRRVVTAKGVQRKSGRWEFRPARIAGHDNLGRELVEFDDATHSGRVAHLPDADGLVLLPADKEYLPEGALVEFQQFRDI